MGDGGRAPVLGRVGSGEWQSTLEGPLPLAPSHCLSPRGRGATGLLVVPLLHPHPPTPQHSYGSRSPAVTATSNVFSAGGRGQTHEAS